jgi:glyoxylase-like metal-dependent hydrolase (beta-lactamase superfamily II)
MKPFVVCEDVFAVGGPELSHPNDCLVYLLRDEDCVLIDTGAGQGFHQILENIRKVAKPEHLKAVIATHCHIDHVGSLHRFRQEFGARIIAHELDVAAIETGVGTGAEFYGVDYEPCQVDIKLKGERNTLEYGGRRLHVIHIPGHSPGSVAVYTDTTEGRVLFGQDIHGPYFFPSSNVAQAKMSLQKLIDLEADVLCEGHFGIYQPAQEVRRYIEGYLFSLRD